MTAGLWSIRVWVMYRGHHSRHWSHRSQVILTHDHSLSCSTNIRCSDVVQTDLVINQCQPLKVYLEDIKTIFKKVWMQCTDCCWWWCWCWWWWWSCVGWWECVWRLEIKNDADTEQETCEETSSWQRLITVITVHWSHHVSYKLRIIFIIASCVCIISNDSFVSEDNQIKIYFPISIQSD